MSDLEKLTRMVIRFRDERDWKQFHNPKDCALSLMLEAAEVAEHFQYKNDAEIARHVREQKGDIADELADVLYWVLLMAHDFKIDLGAASRAKMKKNIKKYPAHEARGRHLKYTELAKLRGRSGKRRRGR